MSRRALYVATGLVLFVLFTLANLPLATVLDWADARQRGLAWQTAGGTVWAGEIGNATYNAYPVGNIRIKTYFLPLLAGRLSVDASIAGPGLAVAGRLSLAPGERLMLQDTAALIDLQQYNIRDAFDDPMAGILRIDVPRLNLRGTNCLRGDFSIWTDSLNATARRYGGAGFPIAGTGYCEGGQLILPVAGQGPNEQVALEIVLDGNLDYQAEVRVRSRTPDLVNALRLYGFDRQGDQLVMIQRGNLLVNP